MVQWYVFNKGNAAHRGLAISPIPSPPLRHQRLGHVWADHLAANVPFPIFVTIQLNTASGSPSRIKTAPGANSPEDRTWAFLGALLYYLDMKITGCPKPGFLGPKDRLQGYAILEKLYSNPHLHILIACCDPFDRFWTCLQLFELLDTVPYRRKDDAWQREMWEAIVSRGYVSHSGRTRTFSPLLHPLAPGATATVQLVRAPDVGPGVFDYAVKELGKATLALATESSYWNSRADLHIRQLSEFHSRAGYEAPASRIRKDPSTGAQTLNLDDPTAWRRKEKRIRHR